VKTKTTQISTLRELFRAVLLLIAMGGCGGGGEKGATGSAEDLEKSEQGIEVRGTPTRIAGGASHSLAVRQDGTAWAWGRNNYGQLGNGTTANQLSPVRVSNLTSVVSVAAGEAHSLALRSDGTVWAWGFNGQGNLGINNTATYKNTPVQVLSLSDAISIAAKNNQSFALKSDGTVWAWGANASGQLGNDSTTSQPLPVQVKQSVGGIISDLMDVVAIAAGTNHTLALKANGTVWAWGDNASGQLGNGTLADQHTAIQVVSLSDAVAISAGGAHSLAMKADGTVVAWGKNDHGQLGDNTTNLRSIPVSVSGLSNAKSVAAGFEHSIALKSDGTVVAWGRDEDGQIGNGSTTTTPVRAPVPVLKVTGVTTVSAGAHHSQAISNSSGAIWGWGRNLHGQVGDDTTTNRHVPVITMLTSGIMSVAGGEAHTLYTKWDGTVWAWGSNVYGQLGEGTPIQERLTPIQVKDSSGTGYLSGVLAVAAGKDYSLALASDGTVFAWGRNGYGQLGDGTLTDRRLPVRIPDLNGIVAIAAGATHALALKFDGKVYAWGRNHLGQLGDETQTDRLTPVQVHYLEKVVAIAAGDNHSLAISQDGAAYTWGSGGNGQLCNSQSGLGHFKSVIAQVPGIVRGVGVAAGVGHSLFLEANGNTKACGDNVYGQLGNGSTTNSSVPVTVTNLDKAVRIVAGGNTSAALSTSGTVYTWGSNSHGQLGDGPASPSYRSTIAQVPDFSNVVTLAVGTRHTITARTDDSAYSWGANDFGQIGDGHQQNRSSPTAAWLP